MSVLHWTPEALARVSSFRRAPTLAPFDAMEAWTKLRAEPLRTDDVECDPALSEAHDALRGALVRESVPNTLDVDAFAIWIRLRPGAAHDIARFGCALLGVEPMIDVWIRTREIAVAWRQRASRSLSIVAPTSPVPLGYALRVPLLNAPSEVRARVRTKLVPWVALGEVPLLAGAVTLCPEEIDWARALAATYLAAPLQAQGFVVVAALHRSACPLDDVRAVTLAAEGSGSDYETLLDTHGSAALPLLMELMGSLKDAHQHDSLARALTIARSPEVAAKLAEHVGKKKVRQRVDAYFQRFPELAEDALTPVSKSKGRAASMAAEMLAQVARANALGESEVGASGEALVDAPREALPSVLAAPPWRGGARKKRKPLVVNGWAEVRLEGPRAWHGARVSRAGSALGAPVGWAVMDDAEAAAWLERVTNGEKALSHGDSTTRRAVPDAVHLVAWSRGCFSHEHSGTLRTMLEVHGIDAAEGALAWARRHVQRIHYAFQLAPLADLELPELAPEMAMALGRRVTSELALRWLRRFSTAAIVGLLPDALGELGARRTAAERVLRLLVRDGVDVRAHTDELVKTSSAIDAKDSLTKTSAALDEVLGWDPLSDCPSKPPKLSERYRPEGLFRPTLRDGRALSLEALRHLDEMLAFTPMDPPYAGIELVREACDPRSLAEHAWSLARSWETSGARKMDDWMMRSLVHLADDEVVRRMTPALKNKLVIDVLVAIGTDAAAMELATIGARGGSGQLRELAESALDRLAEARGVARDRLDEQLTPTLGLDARGGLELDYGPRRFRVVFDEHLVPHVQTGDSKPSPSLPRSRKGDDPTKFEAARAIWDELREDVAAIARFRIQALERMMLADATWSVEELESGWTKHPLMAHLARRMVFVAMREGDAPRTFRIAEDGTYVGIEHETVTLDPDARVGVPHPLRWPDDSLSAWMQMLADYEIVQPFPQLARTVPFIDEAWLASARIKLSSSDPGDGFARRRRLVNCGWNVAVHPLRLEIGDGLFVTATSSAFSRNGVMTQETQLICRRGTEEVPWGEVPRTKLLRVLDAFA